MTYYSTVSDNSLKEMFIFLSVEAQNPLKSMTHVEHFGYDMKCMAVEICHSRHAA